MIAYARAPGTCGEYIQGIFKAQPCLVSSPIDLYSITAVTNGAGVFRMGSKCLLGLDVFFRRFNLNPHLREKINIRTFSELPVSKGMASSTADLCSLFAALGEYFGLAVGEEEISQMCCEVEPSDNLMYGDLNLYNHYTGEVLGQFNGALEGKVLSIVFNGEVSTVDFGYDTEFLKPEYRFAECVDLMREAIDRKDLALAGKAATLSARLNQRALFRPYLEDVISLALDFNAYGVMIGHSGTVMGILESEGFNREKFLEQFFRVIPPIDVGDVYNLNLIQGGVVSGRLP